MVISRKGYYGGLFWGERNSLTWGCGQRRVCGRVKTASWCERCGGRLEAGLPLSWECLLGGKLDGGEKISHRGVHTRGGRGWHLMSLVSLNNTFSDLEKEGSKLSYLDGAGCTTGGPSWKKPDR